MTNKYRRFKHRLTIKQVRNHESPLISSCQRDLFKSYPVLNILNLFGFFIFNFIQEF